MTCVSTTRKASSSSWTGEAVVDPAAAEETLREVCRGVIDDPRFAGPGSEACDGEHLSRRADKVLVARLSALTGQFPVAADLLGRARAMCVEMAAGVRPLED